MQLPKRAITQCCQHFSRLIKTPHHSRRTSQKSLPGGWNGAAMGHSWIRSFQKATRRDQQHREGPCRRTRLAPRWLLILSKLVSRRSAYDPISVDPTPRSRPSPESIRNRSTRPTSGSCPTRTSSTRQTWRWRRSTWASIRGWSYSTSTCSVKASFCHTTRSSWLPTRRLRYNNSCARPWTNNSRGLRVHADPRQNSRWFLRNPRTESSADNCRSIRTI